MIYAIFLEIFKTSLKYRGIIEKKHQITLFQSKKVEQGMILIKAKNEQIKDSVWLWVMVVVNKRSCKDPKMTKDFSKRFDPSVSSQT